MFLPSAESAPKEILKTRHSQRSRPERVYPDPRIWRTLSGSAIIMYMLQPPGTGLSQSVDMAHFIQIGGTYALNDTRVDPTSKITSSPSLLDGIPPGKRALRNPKPRPANGTDKRQHHKRDGQASKNCCAKHMYRRQSETYLVCARIYAPTNFPRKIKPLKQERGRK